MIHTAEALIIELAARQHGVIRRRDALRAGVSASGIDRRVRGGWLIRHPQGLFTVEAMIDRYTPAALAVLSAVDAVLSHHSAARLHQFALPSPSAQTITTPYGGSARSSHAIVHRSRHLPSDDITEAEQLPVTTAARTLCDLAAHLRPTRLMHLVESQLVSASPSADELVTCFESWSGRGVKGSVAMRRVLDALLDDEPFAESKLELLAIERLLEYRVLGARRQYRPPWYDGLRGIVDFAWPGAKVILEVDGRRFHLGSQSKDDDERRDLYAAEHGWIVIRVGWRTLQHRPTDFMRRLAAIIERRTAALAA